MYHGHGRAGDRTRTGTSRFGRPARDLHAAPAKSAPPSRPVIPRQGPLHACRARCPQVREAGGPHASSPPVARRPGPDTSRRWSLTRGAVVERSQRSWNGPGKYRSTSSPRGELNSQDVLTEEGRHHGTWAVTSPPWRGHRESVTRTCWIIGRHHDGWTRRELNSLAFLARDRRDPSHEPRGRRLSGRSSLLLLRTIAIQPPPAGPTHVGSP